MKEVPDSKKFRHRAELPLLALGYVLTTIIIAGCLTVILTGGEIQSWAGGVLLGLFTPIFTVFIARYMYFEKVSNGVELGEKQLPELYELYKNLALEMGFSEEGENKIPQLYIINGNGVLNAFAAKCALHKKYLVLHSDMIDIAYNNNDFGILKFVLAHELGHVKCGHLNLRRTVIMPIMTLLLLNRSLARAQEYTADRVASYYAPDNVDDIIYLYAGKNLGGRVDMEEYIKSAKQFEHNIWLRIVNFMSNHAVGYRRVRALYSTKEKGWDVHGKML